MEYSELLKKGLDHAYAIASEARSKGFDPTEDVEVKIAKDVAARVEGIVGPPGVAETIRAMEKGGMARENIAFEVAQKIAGGELMKANKELLIEQAVRTGLGILTEGVLVAPTEGIAKVKIKNNPDGSDYVAVYYAGPIRSAGGTAAALSLVLADLARRVCGVGDYRATESQIARYYEEITTYETRVTHLQYMPPEEDARVIAANCPICIDGDPTEEIEVSTHRGVPGVETDRVRGGVPLVMCEGVAAKAAKLLKYTNRLNLGWNWLEKIIKIKKKADKIEIKPDPTYLEGLVAGRPVFSHASAKGGFRLRYGRSRTTCLMGKNIHPATMIMLDRFLAYGTHMKIERPGKGCVVAGHDGLEPPAVRLKSGRVMKVRTLEEAHGIKDEVEEILFLGDLLCAFGDFHKSNHPLMPSGYCQEWWERELEAKGIQPPEDLDADALFSFSRMHGVPLHPDFTYHWHDISPEQLKALSEWLKGGELQMGPDSRIRNLSLPKSDAKRVLEELILEHDVKDGKVVLDGEHAFALLSSLGALKDWKVDLSDFERIYDPSKKTLDMINEASGLKIKPKAPTYIGARMGRPEKAKERKMDGSPHVLFPSGSFKNRSLTKINRTLRAREGEKTVNIEISRFRCGKCGKLGFYRRCPLCGERAAEERICQKCGRPVNMEMHCDMKTVSYDRRPVDVIELFDQAKDKVGMLPDEVKGVKGLSNATRIPERLEKGFLRSKHDVYVFRDGTSRFDATDIPVTHFVPKELGLSVQKAKELGYSVDYLGRPLEDENQTVMMYHQDIILAEDGADYFLKVAAFIDDMLMNLYGMKPFYSLKSKSDLIGHFAVGLSPHTSAGALCRVIGFTKATVGYGHPYFHTAKRRNCFHPETEIVIWDDVKKKRVSHRLGALVERAFEEHPDKVRRLDEYTERVDVPDGMFTFGIDLKSNKVVRKKIKCLIRAKAPEKWLKIVTTTNRKMIVTPDHNVLCSDGTGLKALEAKDLKPGADLPVCLKLDIPTMKTRASGINLAEELCVLDAETKDSIMIRCKPFFKKLFYENRKSVLEILDIRDYQRRTPISWYSSVSLSHLELLVKHGICRFDDLPKNAKIAMKRDDMSLPLRIPIDENLMIILGYYIAEGYARQGKSCNQINFRICNRRMGGILARAIKNVFGKRPYTGENRTQFMLCGKIIYLLFTKIFETGINAHTKRIPSIVFSSEDSLVKAFISAYFDGDGSVVADPPRMYLYSVSLGLLEDFGTLLLRFGIFTRYGWTKPRLPGRRLLERYEELGKPPKLFSLGSLSLYGTDLLRFADICSPRIAKKAARMAKLRGHKETDVRFIKYENQRFPVHPKSDYLFDKVKSIESFPENTRAYCLDVEGQRIEEKNVLLNNQMITIRCDGDEDSVMLLMDALINFSRRFLNEKRGGTMDAPLVLSVEINPKEVDDEAHSIEIVSRYPLDFYEAAERLTPPGDIKLKRVKDVLGTPEQYELPITHPGGSLDQGNIRTAYVELQSIPEKIDIQFSLQGRLRPVDKRDAAERLILSHFIPDLYGNLRSFSRQTFRCVSCNTIFRRVPLAGKCNRCGGNLLLTINKGGIEKYLQISRDIVDRYDLPFYLKQRLELVGKEIKSIFEDDKVKQMGLSDFL
ncbi:MAG: DNA polymerase II large subunit [Candidatus Micrarchaeota archaeon]